MMIRPGAPSAPSNPDTTAAGFVDAVRALRYTTPSVSFDRHEKNGIVARLVRDGARVLDVGCGTGGTLKHLRDSKRCEVMGLEPHHSRAEAVEAAGVPIREMTLDQADPANLGRFDYVMFLDVLEHVADPRQVLADAARLLAPGGRVIVSVPNVAHWSVRWALLFGRFDYTESGIMDATHLRWFTRKTLAKMLDAAGYDQESYQVSAGTWLAVYAEALPWKWMPSMLKRPIVRLGAQLAPDLFGAQHIVSSTLRGTAAL
jgi:methionine biosynthesis protein MetW